MPLKELLFGAMMIIVPTLVFFFHLNRIAHGSGSVSFGSDDVVFTIPSESFLSVALDRAAWWAVKPITVLNAPAKFVETLVSLAVARKFYWFPPSWLDSNWHALIYPIYALPAWIYLGRAIDAMIGRRRTHRWNVILRFFFSLTCLLLFCGFRFGMPAAEREGQEKLSWFIDGFAIWAVLFSIPILAWIPQKKRGVPLTNEPLRS